MNNILFKLSDIVKQTNTEESDNIDFEKLLGQIILNRITGHSYFNIKNSKLNFPSEFIKKLTVIFNDNKKSNEHLEKKLRYLSRILSENKFKYAVLKGSFLIPFMYEPGIRTSNDIDILINKSDVSLLQELLKSEDFVQGYFRDGEIIPASRREIIDSLMNNGETIPFMKMINNELLTMDINFSLDFKADNKIVGDILTDCVDMVKDEINLKTLNPVDFIIHLCCHLYKEATTYDWVIRRRDLMLYKFSDINLFLHKYSDEKYLSLLADRIKQFNVEKECYYTFENSAIIYPQIRNIFKFNEFINDIKPDNLDFMKQIIYPREKRLFKYDMDFVDWFFCDNRIKALNEIKYEET